MSFAAIFKRRIASLYQAARVAKYRMLSENVAAGMPVLHQPLLTSGSGSIRFGSGVQIGVRHSPGFYNGYAYAEARFDGGSIEVGDRVRFNNNLVLIATTRTISIGSECLVGHNVEIIDSDFHGLQAGQRDGAHAKNGDVLLGRNVFVGANAKILKGVTIGDNSVIAGGAIVTRPVPADVVAGGVPCRVFAALDGASRSFVHPQGINESSTVGEGTRIWAFAHVLPGARIGIDCNICDHVFIENDVVIGDRVTIKSGTHLWDGIRIEDDVFIGPSVAFTNDPYPRSRQWLAEHPATRVCRGASIGANATLLPGITVGEYAMVGAGAVVTENVPASTVVMGNPAQVIRQLSPQENIR